MNKYKFYKEKSTGKCIPSIEALSIDNYIEIKANTTDAALEKHVPVYEIKDNEISVTVGSIEHPMTNDHYIMWIALVKDEKIILKNYHQTINQPQYLNMKKTQKYMPTVIYMAYGRKLLNR